MQYIKGNPYFKRIHTNIKQYPYLDKNENCDVIIIGGGATGAITAYYFSKLGINTVVLEKSRIAHCSTSATTALLQYELDQSASELAQNVPIDTVIQSYQLGIEALSEIDIFIKENGNHCNYAKRDTVLYTEKQSNAALLLEEYELRKEHNFDVHYISKENNPFSFHIEAGIHSIDGGAELDPFLYTHQLLEVSAKNGVRIYENTEAVDVNYFENKVVVKTSYEYEVTGKIVIIATGYNISLFTKRQLGTKTVTYNVVTKPLNTINGWPNHVLLRDTNKPYHYLRTTPDNRIIIGGEDLPLTEHNMSEGVAEKQYELLLSKLKSMFPFIQQLEVEYKFCGVFATTENDLGYIGRDPNNDKLWFNLGYGANGILFAILGGKMLTALYEGKTVDALKLFAINR